MRPSSVSATPAGGSSPARATRCRRNASETRTGPITSLPISAIPRISTVLSAEAKDFLDGPLHALVNNAGVWPKSPTRERLGTLNGDIEDWHRVFHLNFLVPLILSRAFAAALARGNGAIVNITSIAGHMVHPFAGSAYATSKAALSALTREMAADFTRLGVRVNAVAPGEIETAMVGPEYDSLIPRIPLHRLGTPEEVAGVVYQLCALDFGYVTGSEIFITGGQHLL